jgi:hypothetical protein
MQHTNNKELNLIITMYTSVRCASAASEMCDKPNGNMFNNKFLT